MNQMSQMYQMQQTKTSSAKEQGALGTPSQVLACDIDGTLLRDGEPTTGLGELRARLHHAPAGLRLVYATGRTFASVQELIRRGVLPPPDAVATQVGTELWLPPWREPLHRYARYLGEGWDAEAARDALARLAGVTLQQDRYQTPYKASAFVAPAHLEAVQSVVRAELQRRGLEARFVYSGERFLDVLPALSGKGAALRFLERLWEGDPSLQVVACGDSGNDADMLADPATFGVIVGNADDDRLDHLRPRHRVYRADREYAAGVLEGASVVGMLPGRPTPARMSPGSHQCPGSPGSPGRGWRPAGPLGVRGIQPRIQPQAPIQATRATRATRATQSTRSTLSPAGRERRGHSSLATSGR
jgi:sucrose-6F-phosphate phosphohydrolase